MLRPIENLHEEKFQSKSGLENKSKDLVRTIGKGIAKSIAYPIGTAFVFPTMLRKGIKYDNEDYTESFMDIYDSAKNWAIFSGAAVTSSLYFTLALTNPKLIVPVALTQLGTNIASAGYELGRKALKKE
jgi:hypothetical protein